MPHRIQISFLPLKYRPTLITDGFYTSLSFSSLPSWEADARRGFFIAVVLNLG